MIRVKKNPDKHWVEVIQEALEENDGYCPCSVTNDADTKCMCADFRKQLEQGIPGKCHCGLYICEVGDA